MKKIGIIGVGHVGATVAYTLICKNICNEIVLIDVDKEKCDAEQCDMFDAIVDTNQDTKIFIGEYNDLDDADIIVVTAGGGPSTTGSTDRLDALNESMKIIDIISEQLKKTKFNGIVINIGNPADIVATRLLEKTGYDKNKVISTGTLLDSNRLRAVLIRETESKYEDVEAYMLGEHGESQFACFSNVKINGKGIDDYFSTEEQAKIEKEVKKRGWRIFLAKGSTEYGVSQSAIHLIQEIYDSSDKYLPFSVYLDGQYGYSDIHISTLAKLGKDGAYDIQQVKMSEEEMSRMKSSIQRLRRAMGKE